MSYTVIFVLIFGIIAIQVQSECDETMCSNVCNVCHLPGGTCIGNACDCFYGKNCTEMVDMICDVACDKLELKGECDEDGHCICKAELEPCPPWDCEEQCLEDPRAAECEAMWGIVTPIACLKYGPVRTCGCLCTYPEDNSPLRTSVRKNKFNYWQKTVGVKKQFKSFRSVLNNIIDGQ